MTDLLPVCYDYLTPCNVIIYYIFTIAWVEMKNWQLFQLLWWVINKKITDYLKKLKDLRLKEAKDDIDPDDIHKIKEIITVLGQFATMVASPPIAAAKLAASRPAVVEGITLVNILRNHQNSPTELFQEPDESQFDTFG